MNSSSCKLISAVLAVVMMMGCAGDVQVEHSATGRIDSLGVAADSISDGGAGMQLPSLPDSIQDSTRKKTDLELRRERDLQRKMEFHGKWTGQQLDSMRAGKVTLPPTKLSPEKQRYLDSIQRAWQGGQNGK